MLRKRSGGEIDNLIVSCLKSGCQFLKKNLYLTLSCNFTITNILLAYSGANSKVV